MFDPSSLLAELARDRPIFHSEADFQHALAWLTHTRDPDAQIRLETRPIPDEPLYLDLAIGDPGSRIAIELKYLTRSLIVDLGGEVFALRNQGAQDISRYDIVKDIVRLERIVRAGKADVGFGITVTNDPSYWRRGQRPDTIDSDFRLHDGRQLTGSLSWSERAGAGTTRGREIAHQLEGSYSVSWRDYSRVAPAPAGLFRYLLIEVR